MSHMRNDIISNDSGGVGIKPYSQFLNEIYRSPCTGWRWRKNRWINTINIAGKLYVTAEEMARFRARAEAFRSQRLATDTGDVPFYLLAARASLALDHVELIAAIRAQLPSSPPIAVYLDTLNRSLNGSENDDRLMKAAGICFDILILKI